MDASKQGSTDQMEKEHKLDKFCWTYHGKEPTLFCSTCALSFHNSTKCSGTRNLSAKDIGLWKCVECIAIEEDKKWIEAENINAQYLKSLLEGAVDSLTTVDADSAAKFPNELAKIGDKVNAGLYLCLEEFLLDVKRIAYNVSINRLQNVVEQKSALKAAKSLIRQTKEELYQIRLCHECYFNLNQTPSESDWIIMVCEHPHLLVWAKAFNSFAQWPAKVMAANPYTKKVDVVYFGSYKHAVLESKQCRMFSKSNPNTKRTKLLDQAQEEVAKYIENVKAKFGVFNYASENTPLNIENLDRHLHDMIPNAWALLGKSIPPPNPPVLQRNQRPVLQCVHKTVCIAEPKQQKQAPKPLSPEKTKENVDPNADVSIQMREQIRLLEEENAKLTADLADANSTNDDLKNQFNRLSNMHENVVGMVRRFGKQMAELERVKKIYREMEFNE